MTPTEARSLVSRLVADKPGRALEIAREIEAPWFRCQALSQVARYWPDERYGRFLVEAVRAADAQDQLFNRIAVLAWPIRAYLERGNVPPARKLLDKGVQAAGAIENMGSRSEALFGLFQASKPFSGDLWQPVFSALVEAAEPARSWRQRRNLKDAVAMVAATDPPLARHSLDQLSDPKNLSAIQRCLDEAVVAKPRPYFWIEGERAGGLGPSADGS